MSFPAFAADRITPVANQDYPVYVGAKIRGASQRIWAAVFIVDPRPDQDVNGTVRDFVMDLEQAAWRGIDVRILIGISDTLDIRMANAVAHHFLREKGVAVRYFRPTQHKTSMHSKYVVLDDRLVVLGGHNWSPGSFERHVQDSVGIFSTEINEMLAAEFAALWDTAEEEKAQ